MTPALARCLSFLDWGEHSLYCARYDERQYAVSLTDHESRKHAVGMGQTLEEACQSLLDTAQAVGMTEEPRG